MMLAREEAWKKIHAKALQNPLKDQVRGLDISNYVAVNKVSFSNRF